MERLRLVRSGVVVVAVAAAFWLLGGVAQASVVTLSFTTGGCSTSTVPSQATSVAVYAVGAAGDTGGVPLGGAAGGTGGDGDAVSGTLKASAGNPITVCVDMGAAIGGNAGAIDAGAGGGASYALDPDWSDGKGNLALIVAGGGGGGGTSGGYGFIAGDGGNAGDAGGGPLGTGGPAPPSSANALNNAAGAPVPDSTASEIQDGQEGAGTATTGAGGGGGGGYLGGYGGGYTGFFASPEGDGGGSGGTDYCVDSSVTSGCAIDAGAGTVHGAGSAAGDAEVTLSYDLPDPTISITTPANGGSYALNQTVTPSFSCGDPSGIYLCEATVGESDGHLRTASPGTFSFTVTAIANDGSQATKTVTYSVAEPTETITTPAADATYLVGQQVPSDFTCADGAGAPGLTATGGCVDQNGNPSGTALDTSTPGAYTYEVTATSQDGTSTTSTVTYYVTQILIVAPKPSGDSVYALGVGAPASFSCSPIPGYGDPTCVDAKGESSEPFGLSTVDTSTMGTHTFEVFASVDGGPPAELGVPYDVQATQTITWGQQGPFTYGQLPEVFPYGQAVTLDAIASSGFPVRYSVASGPCEVVDYLSTEWLMTASGAGACVIDANQAGDGVDYSAAPTVPQTITIHKAVMHVDANSVTTTHGTPPTLGYTLRASDFVNGDTPASIGLTGSPVCTSSAGSSPAVGTYPGAITCDPSAMSAPNYTFVAGSSGTLTVTAATLKSVALTPAPVSLAKGASTQLKATGSYGDGSTADLTGTVTWSTSNSAVATVSGGRVTAVGTGTATITATDGSLSATDLVTVTAATLESIAIAPASPSAAAGETVSFTVTATFSDGTHPPIADLLSWSSSNTTVATVSADGVATAKAAGTTTIRAALDGVSASTTLTVTPAAAKARGPVPRIRRLVLRPRHPHIRKGRRIELRLTAILTNHTTVNLTRRARWSARDRHVATVNKHGIVTAIAHGTTTIQARSRGHKASIRVTVVH